MANSNCLRGMACPECSSDGPFDIVAHAVFRVSDDGSEEYGDMDWEDDSSCTCVGCGHHGDVSDFKAPEMAEAA